MKYAKILTAFGPMVVVGDEEAVCGLSFGDDVPSCFKSISAGFTASMKQLEKELEQYAKGHLRTFKTPYKVTGTPFQERVWRALTTIPYGETRSYMDLAALINLPKACRAVGNANGANPLAILIPCHRVIHKDGSLGGYAGGLSHKEKLLAHEQL